MLEKKKSNSLIEVFFKRFTIVVGSSFCALVSACHSFLSMTSHPSRKLHVQSFYHPPVHYVFRWLRTKWRSSFWACVQCRRVVASCWLLFASAAPVFGQQYAPDCRSGVTTRKSGVPFLHCAAECAQTMRSTWTGCTLQCTRREQLY